MKTGVILARLQPIHNGHLALIKKASEENDQVYVFVGSADKFNQRNPIPIWLRLQLATEATKDIPNVHILPLDDLTNEGDNSHDWGFYLYSNVVSATKDPNFTIYYSDGFEIITTWFPSFILKNNVSLSLLARNSIESGVSATLVRRYIMENDEHLVEVVPQCVFNAKDSIRNHIEISKLIK